MGYTFARVGAATEMKVEDFYVQKRRGWDILEMNGDSYRLKQSRRKRDPANS
jgi:hypothetical protein